ncbi:hypothetical protein KUCAC02_033574 [Chaenocephalus aceratus]|nr:hypothetical protein KUCAC02_033574 [Chaenocephalus aceratus]
MFEVKPRAVEKKESSTETDEGLGSSGKTFGSMGSGSADSGSVYLSDSQDWAVSPGCSPDDGTGQLTAISPMLAEETFRYMTYLALEPSSHSHPGSQSLSKVLSGDRVEQMTKAYNDIDVVSHLLAERDRDLELAARIGQSLLQRNHLLQERNEAIEEQLAQTVDQVHQLQHELSKKDELLRMVASASEERETDSSVSPPLRQPPALRGNTTSSTLSQLENLQSKLQDLEEENLALRSEACQLKTDTITYEEKEQQLVSDCVKELRESNGQMVSLTDELSHKNEDLLRHQEEIAQLLSQIVELQHRVKELALEKEELRIHLQASKESQRQLTAELDELADRNAECLEMLHESQEEIRELRNKNTPAAGMRRPGRRPRSKGEKNHGQDRGKERTKRDTEAGKKRDSLAAEIEGTMRRELSVDEENRLSGPKVTSATPPIPGSGQSSLVMTAQPFQSNQGEEVRIGQPGCPGGNDLNRALHRLSLRRQNFMCERRFFQAEREKKMQALSETDGESSGCVSPMGSNMSSFSNLSELSFSSSVFRTFLPEKLQIVKPMEGSLTLHHWQQLAQPHLATILDPHPGVSKSQGRCQSSTFSTYTFTTCSILHPSDVTQVTSSSQSSIMANTPSSMRTGPSTPVTPCRLSLGDCFPLVALLYPPEDVYGLNLGRAPHPDLPSPSQEAPARAPSPKLGRPRPDLGLVERLRRLGFTKVLQGSKSDASAPRQDCSTFISAGGGSLLDERRRHLGSVSHVPSSKR